MGSLISLDHLSQRCSPVHTTYSLCICREHHCTQAHLAFQIQGGDDMTALESQLCYWQSVLLSLPSGCWCSALC